jgi:transposase InsO family protein
MPGRRITNQQVEIYMESRQQGYAQVTAAAKAGLSERSGRDIELGKRPSAKPTKRHWRTRADPLEAVWDTELLLMLERSPDLQPITLLEYLQSRYEGMYPDKVLRTLQRRIKTWQALHGHEKVVMFRQSHVSGRMGLSDFTTLKKISITINAEPFEHLLYHFRLAFSHWSYMKVIQGGESFTALAQGLQEALRRLGGAPLEHRTDSLSAAFKNLTQDEGDDITSRYDALCKHYGMTATRNNRGCCHENGSIESPHGHLKRRIQQALILRGSCDFSCVAAWQQFIDDVVQGHNRRHAKAVVEERLSLQPLPHYGATDYTELSVVVSRSSTIDVRRVTYTVPSRLQGETLHIHLYDNKLVCFLGHVFLMELTRLHPKKNMRARQVDYRHVIHSLVKKPQAFRYATLRQELLPNADYQTIWTHLDTTRPPKEACKVMVGILHLAAKEDCEETLGKFVLTLIEHAGAISLRSLQGHFTKQPTSIPEIAVMQHGLAYYNRCIPMHQEVIHA